MEKNSDAIFGLLVLVGLVVGIGSLLIYVSLDRERYIEKIRKTMKVVLVIGLLPLAYWVYPEGITSIPFAKLTLGEIGRLFTSVILVMSFIVIVVFLVRGIRDY